MSYPGRHFLAEFYNCSSVTLNDEKKISDILIGPDIVSGAAIIQPLSQKFSPHGISSIIVTTESHLAIQTWPEFCFAALDIFSCSNFNYSDALKFINKTLNAWKYSTLSIKRGIDVTSYTGLPVSQPDPEKIYL
jgi:S-adenosylmethionine decarboxylase